MALTFDVDADVGVGWRRIEERLTSLSEAAYGIRRGVPRILKMLAERDLPATFYVPGEIAERYPDLVRAIDAAGHEVGHHGHFHLRADQATAREQRNEVERGLQALAQCAEVRPGGFRSPAWELTPETFDLLVEFEFQWDSSCMGDDRPYIERHRSTELLELPVHWSLDDWVYFGFSRDHGGVMSAPDSLRQSWLLEFESALAEGRMVTYTMHPEVIGRGYRMRILESLVDDMHRRGDVWFATHREVARLVTSQATHGTRRGDQSAVHRQVR